MNKTFGGAINRLSFSGVFQILRWVVVTFALFSILSAYALTPQEIFRLSEPSIAIVEVVDDHATIIGAFSAIALDKDHVATQCDLLSTGPIIRVSYRGHSATAAVDRRDNQRNLCILAVSGVNMVSARMGPDDRVPTVGSTVYALGNTLGMGTGISDGVVSGVREYAGDSYIQFTAAIAHGSQGGGLFDAEGRLIGIIQYRPIGGQNVNFARPAKWLSQIEARSEQSSRSADWSTRAITHNREENWRALAEHAQRWTAADSNSIEALLYLGFARLRLKDWQIGEKTYREVLKREPASIPAALGLAQALLNSNQSAAVIELLRPLLAQNRENGELWSSIGYAELDQKHSDKAESAFREAIRIEPWNRGARFGLIALARSRSDWRGALRELRVLTASNVEDKSANLMLAEAYLKSGRPVPALATAERILANYPNDADALLWKGASLIALKRNHEGIDALKQCVTGKLLGPEWGWGSLGDAYATQKLWPEAIASYREGLKIAPDNLYLQRNFGIALKDSGQFTEAMAIFEKIKTAHPNDPFPWRQIGYVHGYLDQADKAIPVYERALALDPKDPKLWRALMEAYHSAGSNNDMRRAYDKLSGVDRQWADAAYHDLILPYEPAR